MQQQKNDFDLQSMTGFVDQDKGHRFGNFGKYYDFHAPQKRIDCLGSRGLRALLPKRMQDNTMTMCDVGSNSGDLTLALCHELALLLRVNDNVCALGIELDPGLVLRSSGKVTLNRLNDIDCVASCESEQLNDNDQAVESEQLHNNDCAASSSQVDDGAKCQLRFSVGDASLPVDDVQSAWHHMDAWLAEHGTDRFDVVTLFSMTMWVHVNHGDAGLERLVAEAVKRARVLLVEPQPLKCYKSARRRLNRLKRPPLPAFDAAQPSITIAEPSTPERTIDRMIRKHIGENARAPQTFGPTEWSRSLSIYQVVECK
jgi:Bicoid-interacting protein 3 (Bin3)